MTLEQAIVLATEAHAGQKDKAGEPYILHPLRVMMRMTTEEERILAVLHDVVEDTDIAIESLASEDFEPEILAALDAITKREGEPYGFYIRRLAENPLATRVKLADLLDNTDPSRRSWANTPEKRHKLAMLLGRYQEAMQFLADVTIGREGVGPSLAKEAFERSNLL